MVNRLSKYTLEEIDSIFKDVLSPMSYDERIEIYNNAQTQIADLVNDIRQITNFLVSNNTLYYSESAERDRINPLSKREVEAIKIGTVTLDDIKAIIGEENIAILNAAQDILNKIKNSYDEYGYYQLWYNANGDVFTSSEETINGFSAIFVYKTSPRKAATKIIGFNASIGYLLDHPDIFVVENTGFSSGFTYSTKSAIAERINKKINFKTKFEMSVYTPIIYEQENIIGFNSTFNFSTI